MRTDVSGWITRLTDEYVRRYQQAGAWRDVTVADCAIREGSRAPERIAVVEGERAVRFGEIVAEARQLSAAFGAMGLQPGEVISF